jgi:hypothetical protein
VLIHSALNNATNKAFRVWHFIHRLYVQHPEIRLSQTQLVNLAAWLWHDARPEAIRLARMGNSTAEPIHLEVVDNLLTILAHQQPKEFKRFMEAQERSDYLALAAYLAPAPEPPKADLLDQEDTDDGSSEPDPMAVVVRELRRKQAANLLKLGCCLERISVTSFRHLHHLFSKLIHLLAALEDAKVERSHDLLRRICWSHFTDAKLLRILNNSRLDLSLVKGFARFLWHCDIELLPKSDQYYPNLYHLFCRANGDQRRDLALIFLAIKEATGNSVLGLPTLDKQHVQLITRLTYQFRTEEAS